MLDLETLGTDSNAVIISISAIVFDLKTGKTGAAIEIGVDVLEQMLNGGIVDNDTISWWANQNKETKGSLYRLGSISVKRALSMLNKFITEHAACDFNTCKLWGNGSVFDNVILRNLYKRTDIQFVLPYWCDMDVRTLVCLTNTNTRDFKFVGIKHNGIDDCKHQINYCSYGYNKFNAVEEAKDD